MNFEKIAKEIKEGEKIHLVYQRELSMLKTWTGAKIQKISDYVFIYNPDDYFTRNLDHYGTHLESVKEESDYEKVSGILYRHTKTNELYIRFAAVNAERRKVHEVGIGEPTFISEGKEIDLFSEEILPHLASKERPDKKKTATRQITSTGKAGRDVKQFCFKLERIQLLEVLAE